MRAFRLILSAYVLLWFNVVVPGHTRGIITLPNGGKGASCCPACCANNAAAKGQAPTPQQERNCAICFVAALYTLPPVFTIDLQPAERVATLNVAALPQLVSLDFPTPFWPIGPPDFV